MLVAPNANPPVAKIIDFGHYKYELRKKEREGKKKKQEVKGIKISPRIAEHDMAFMLKNARKFLSEGDKVRISCKFKAREITHPEIGEAKLKRMAADLEDIAVLERIPTLEGKDMVMVLAPKPVKPTGTKKSAEAENEQNGSEEVQGDGIGEDHAPTEP